MQKITQSEQLFKEGCVFLPGGVNSPVRAYQSVGGTPPFIEKADGPFIYDVDGCCYVDFVGSWGPMILGHNHPAILKAVTEAAQNGLSFGAATRAEVTMAKLLCSLVPSLEMVRMVNSGTEAVMSAIRAARGYTGRDKIIKFEGCYHGHFDALLVKAGSGVMTAGVPDSQGVPKGCAKDTLTAVYNNIESVEMLFDENPGEIAALIIEPVAANMGVVLPEEGFLKALRSLCTRHGTVLIFDEVITGFRLSLAGAQGYYNVTPDLTAFGKIIGGGMPVGCYGGKKEIMEQISPLGNVYQAGTLSGNPIAMAAGITQLNLLKDQPEIYDKLSRDGEYFRTSARELLKRRHMPYDVTGCGSLSCIFFTNEKVVSYETAKTADTKKFAEYFHFMLKNGMYFAPSQFEAIFFSSALTRENIDNVLTLMDTFFAS